MIKSWTNEAWEDYLYWQSNDEDILDRINRLIKEIERDPFKGIGKPEPLKHKYQGYWSRHINKEHRLIYKIENDQLFIISCRYHYDDK